MMLLIAAIQILFILPRMSGAFDGENFKFPAGFKIGVNGGSAYQTEGAWNVGDKQPSNWDMFTHEKADAIVDRSNGDVACDSFHKYKEDIKIVKDIGFDHYRLSLSWARILPNGIGSEISKDGIEYYKNVLDELKKQEIEPYVTIYHWDHPATIENWGGWLNETIVENFANYARIIFRELGSRVRFWTTINEPIAYCYYGYGLGFFIRGKPQLKTDPYICGHNMLKAHAEAYHIYDNEFRASQKGQIGIVNTCMHFFAIDKNDVESPDIAFQFNCGWLSHPIFSKDGDYPKVMKESISENSEAEGLAESRLPVFSTKWIEYIRGTSDYFGLNYYTSRTVQLVTNSNQAESIQDSGIIMGEAEDWPNDVATWLKVVPDGLRGILNKIKEEYNNPPVYILENGIASVGGMFDLSRIFYIKSHIRETLMAINQDGCDVRAYTIWSLLDAFEWMGGYTQTFGIVHVNHTDPNRPRTLRFSATWLKYFFENDRS